MADIDAMKQPERIALFADRSKAHGRITIELAKLISVIRRKLARNQTLYGVLEKAGVPKGTVSTARRNGDVFDSMVVSGGMPEENFDDLTSADLNTIYRAMSGEGHGKKAMTAPAILALMAEKPDTFDAELESIFATGKSIANAAEAEKKKAAKQSAEPVSDVPTGGTVTLSVVPPVADKSPDPEPQGAETPAESAFAALQLAAESLAAAAQGHISLEQAAAIRSLAEKVAMLVDLIAPAPVAVAA